MQKVFIAGNVSNVKELRQVGDNKVFNFSVAVSNGKNQDGSWKDSTFWEAAVWGKRGEALARFLTKGTKVAVSGRFGQARVHEGKAYLSLDAEDVTLQGGGEQQGQSGGGSYDSGPSQQQPSRASEFDEQIPF